MDVNGTEPEGNNQQEDKQEDKQQDGIEETLSGDSEALLTQYAGCILPATVARVVEDFINGSEDTARPFADIAHDHNFEPEQFSKDAYAVREAFTAQAQQAIQNTGLNVEPKAVLEWAAGSYDRGYLAEVQRNHYFKGDLSAYQKMAKAYAMRVQNDN